MGRKILGGIAGVLAAILTIAVVEWLAHLAYAPPANIDMNDPKAVSAFVATLPMGAFLSVLLAYVAGTFAGGWVAARVAKDGHWRYAAIIGALVLVGALANIVAIPHPAWFVIASLICVPASAFLAARQVRVRSAR